MDDDDPYVMKSLSMSERAEKIKTMDKDAIASASVLSVRECENQHQRLIATATDDYFEVLVTNDQPLALSSEDENLLRFSTYVDGLRIDNLIVDPQTDAIIQGQHVSSSRQFGVRRMRFAPLRPDSSREGAARDVPASQAGRVDVIVRQVRSIEMDEDFGYDPWIDHRHYGSSDEDEDEDAGFAPAPDTSLAATLGNAEKKRVFGQEAAFDDQVATGGALKATRSKCTVVYDVDSVLATFSFRYAAIEGLQISKTNPKAWQDWQWHQIEEARVASRELRKSLRGGSAVTEPPSYLFRVVVEELVKCERFPRKSEGKGYTKHEIRQQKDWYFDNEYGRLFRAGKSPIKTAKQWLEFVKARRAAHDGAMAANQIYDDALARSDDPPPLVPGDHVLVRAAKGAELEESPKGRSKKIARKSYAGMAPRKQLATMYHEKMAVLQKEKDAKLLVVPTKEQLIDYEAVVLAAGTTDSEVQVKQVGSAHTETLSRNSKRLGVGLASRRGAAVAEMQVEIFAQAFSNVFGVMLYLLMVSGSDKKLRVVRVMPRPGRRVLINGIAVAHLGGAFDSIERHNEIIEIQSGDESDEDDAPPAPAPPPRKKSRTSKSAKFKADPGAVKSERRA
ncbi:hypothetical protein JL721_5632 [Aureococcus anophagefferens]|nr:hypothetical protein JL721_5632 [Aureococcus anophagefferens]